MYHFISHMDMVSYPTVGVGKQRSTNLICAAHRRSCTVVFNISSYYNYVLCAILGIEI